MEHDDAVKRIAQIEFHLRYEQHWLADQALPTPGLGTWGTEELEDRATDLRYVLDLRWKKRKVGHAVEWFRERPRKTLEHRAWLAEALVENDTLHEARTILRDLDKRDVMPDGHGYATLARITQGDERIAALSKCRKRAVVKSICGAAPRTT